MKIHGKFAALFLLFSTLMVLAGVKKSEIDIELGPKAFREGDVIEIENVKSTSQKLEAGDTVTVIGAYHLKSHPEAQLCLFLTQTKSDGKEMIDPRQVAEIKKGNGRFELTYTIKYAGYLHLTFYDKESGSPFGGCYLGTTEQMKAIEKLDVSHYLGSN